MGFEDAFDAAVDAAQEHDLISDETADWLEDADEEVSAMVGGMEEAELAQHYLDKGADMTGSEESRVCQLALETGDTDLLVSLSAQKNLSPGTAEQILQVSKEIGMGRGLNRPESIVFFAQLNQNPAVASLHLQQYQANPPSKENPFVPLYLTGLPDDLAQLAYDVAPNKYVKTFPGSPLARPKQVQKAVDRSAAFVSNSSPTVALDILYSEGEETGIMDRNDLSPEQRTQIGEALLTTALDRDILQYPEEVQAMDQLLREIAYSPRTVTPETFIAIVDKFSGAYSGFATPETVTAVAERTQRMYENGKIDDAQYKDLRGSVRHNLNSYLPEGERVDLRAIFQRDRAQV